MLFDIICIICLIILFIYFICLRFINLSIFKKRLNCNRSICLYFKRGIFYTKFKLGFFKSNENVDFCIDLLNNYFIFNNVLDVDFYSYISNVYTFLIPNRKIKKFKKLKV